MSDRDSGPPFVQNRRQFLSNTAAISAAGLLPARSRCLRRLPRKALPIRWSLRPRHPSGLDIEFDVSLGSIDTLGAIYEYCSVTKMADPNAPGVMRETLACIPTSRTVSRSRASWLKAGNSPDARKATFKLREGAKSNWGNPFTAKDVNGPGTANSTSRARACSRRRFWVCIRRSDQNRGRPRHFVQPRQAEPDPAQAAMQPREPDLRRTKCAEVGGKDDPWAVQFLKNDSAGFGPYRLSSWCGASRPCSRRATTGAKPAMKRVIMKEVPTSASRLSLLQGARSNRSIPSAARTAVAQGGQRGRGRLRQRSLRSGSS